MNRHEQAAATVECNGPRDCVGTERGCSHCDPEKFKTEHPAAVYPFDHSTLCAVNATGHSGPCTCGVVESDREANRPGDATNAPGHDTEEVTSMPDQPNADLWYGRAERLLDDALDAIRDERIDDALSNASLAVAVMHVPDGTQDADEFEGYSWPGEPEDESDCTCPPELRERGGFTSRCPVHGR